MQFGATFLVLIVHDAELLQILHENCRLHHTLDARPGRLQNGAQIGQSRLRFRCDAAGNQLTGDLVHAQAAGHVHGAIGNDRLTFDMMRIVQQQIFDW